MVADHGVFSDQEACHRTPLYRGVTLPHLGWNLLGGLSDDFQATHEGATKRLVRVKRLRSEISAMRDEIVGLGEDVPKILTRLEGHPPLRLRCEGRERVKAPR